jgi:hypothetical protein
MAGAWSSLDRFGNSEFPFSGIMKACRITLHNKSEFPPAAS